jgi:hypothetical protein
MASQAKFFEVSTKGIRDIVGAAHEARDVYRKPFGDDRGKEAARILRFGPRGIAEQFDDQTEYRRATAAPWASTKPFGAIPAPHKTMQRTGAYKSGWLGGAGSDQAFDDTSIRVGVKESTFPQVRIHQGNRKVATVKAKKLAATSHSGKDWAMRFKLAGLAGIWLSIKKVRVTGMKIARRRLSISSDVLKAIRAELHAEFGKAARKFKVQIQKSKATTPKAKKRGKAA